VSSVFDFCLGTVRVEIGRIPDRFFQYYGFHTACLYTLVLFSFVVVITDGKS
jgi:hypothetical protein